MTAVTSQTHYEVLGVQSTASIQEIRKSYLRRALLEHPDKGGSKERFQILVIAFEVLSSTRLRAAYDKQFEFLHPACFPEDVHKQSHANTRSMRQEKRHTDLQEKRWPKHTQHAHKQRRTSSESAAANPQNVAQRPSDTPSKAEHCKDADAWEASTPLDVALKRLENSLRRLDALCKRKVLGRISLKVRVKLAMFMEAKQCRDTDRSHVTSSPDPHSDIKLCIFMSSESSSSADSSDDISSAADSDSSDSDVLALQDSVELYAGSLCSIDACITQPAQFKRRADVSESIIVSCNAEESLAIRNSPNSKARQDDAADLAKETRRSRPSNIKGVMSTSGERSKTPSYCAVVDISHLLVQTRSVRLEVALQYHAVLIQAKQTVLDSGSKDLETQIPGAISAACAENSIGQDDMGLAYSPIVCAWVWLGANIHGRFSIDLPQALAQRQRLLDAKECGWPDLRKEWIHLLTAEITTRRTNMGHRLRAKSVEEATKVVDAAWVRSAKHREDTLARRDRRHAAKEARLQAEAERRKRGELRRALAAEKKRLREEVQAARESRRAAREERAEQQRRLNELRVERAAAAVERLLQTQMQQQHRQRQKEKVAMRQAAAFRQNTLREEARIQKRRRDERWRWMSDSARTMDEILGNAPSPR